VIYPPPIWTPPLPTLILPGRYRPEPARANSRRMLLGPGGQNLRARGTIRQIATNVNAASMTFALNTKLGNLLVYCGERRNFAIASPSDGETWTAKYTGQHQVTSGSNENGFGIYCTVVTVVKATYNTAPSPQWACMYEIDNGPPISSITAIGISDQAAGTTENVGVLGAPGPEGLGVAMFCNGADNVTVNVTPGLWIRDFYDLGSSTGDSAFNNYPYTYIAHRYGDGSAMNAIVSIDSSQKWGGAAVLLP